VECRHQGQISLPEHVDAETQVLDLSGNNLQILPREVFARHGLVNLQRLHLASCNIGQIDPAAFRGLTNLVELNLAGNLLTAIPTATFSGTLNAAFTLCVSLVKVIDLGRLRSTYLVTGRARRSDVCFVLRPFS
jgi:Leucine-rich repeat (LRR) protein